MNHPKVRDSVQKHIEKGFKCIPKVSNQKKFGIGSFMFSLKVDSFRELDFNKMD